MQLYDLQADPGETTNHSADEAHRVADLTQLLETLVENGRSTPGQRQANTAPVDIRTGLPKKNTP